MKCSAGIFCAIFFCLICVTAIHAQVTSTFDADLEGWQVTGDNSAAWEGTTGHPGGCLSVNDWAIGDMNYIISPPKYHGDWSSMTASDSISAEIYFQNTSGDTNFRGGAWLLKFGAIL